MKHRDKALIGMGYYNNYKMQQRVLTTQTISGCTLIQGRVLKYSAQHIHLKIENSTQHISVQRELHKSNSFIFVKFIKMNEFSKALPNFKWNYNESGAILTGKLQDIFGSTRDTTPSIVRTEETWTS